MIDNNEKNKSIVDKVMSKRKNKHSETDIIQRIDEQVSSTDDSFRVKISSNNENCNKRDILTETQLFVQEINAWRQK